MFVFPYAFVRGSLTPVFLLEVVLPMHFCCALFLTLFMSMRPPSRSTVNKVLLDLGGFFFFDELSADMLGNAQKICQLLVSLGQKSG